eukprot:1772332-Prymnesium_polylepis.1
MCATSAQSWRVHPWSLSPAPSLAPLVHACTHLAQQTMWCDRVIVNSMCRLDFEVHPELSGVRGAHRRRARGAPLPIMQREYLAMQRHLQVLREESWSFADSCCR